MSNIPGRRQIGSHLLLVGSAFCWGINPIFMKVGLEEVPPIPYTTLRLAFAALILLPFQLVGRSRGRMRRHRDYRLLIVPVLGFAVFETARDSLGQWICPSLGASATPHDCAARVRKTP